MALKGWFRSGGEADGEELSVEDLIVLERYEEAEARLKARLKTNPDDLHAHLKLADVYIQLGQGANAVDEYVFVAEEYAQDGFYDKGIALLSKAVRLAPMDDSLRLKIESFNEAKRLEHKRTLAIEGVRSRDGAGADGGSASLEFQRLWHHLARSSLIQHLAPEQLKRLFASMGTRRLGAGAALAEEGNIEACLFLILKGVVDAQVSLSEDEPTTLRSFSAGDLLGEAALFERQPWPARFEVVEDALFLTLDRAGLEKALQGNPDPRALLEALREQRNDRSVAVSVMKLRASN